MTKPRLSERRIAEHALKLIDELRVEGLTMRGLAASLDTDPMAIYKYFPDKDAILEAVVQLVLSEVEAPSEELGWQIVVRRIMWSFREVGLRHPHVAPLLQRHPPRTVDAIAFVEAGFRALRRAGFDDAAIARSYSALAAYSFGTLSTEVNSYFAAPHAALQQPADFLDTASKARLFPLATQVGLTLSAQDNATQFEYGLELMLAGFEQRHTAVKQLTDTNT